MSEKMTCPRRVELDNKVGEDHWREDNTCSFCGSLKPSKFFEYVEKGYKVTPTDKTYKVYISNGDIWAKVYFQHFSDEDRKKFADLYNSHKMTLGYPGYFYVTPFIVREVTING